MSNSLHRACEVYDEVVHSSSNDNNCLTDLGIGRTVVHHQLNMLAQVPGHHAKKRRDLYILRELFA